MNITHKSFKNSLLEENVEYKLTYVVVMVYNIIDNIVELVLIQSNLVLLHVW